MMIFEEKNSLATETLCGVGLIPGTHAGVTAIEVDERSDSAGWIRNQQQPHRASLTP